jgi:hypothetical protein
MYEISLKLDYRLFFSAAIQELESIGNNGLVLGYLPLL